MESGKQVITVTLIKSQVWNIVEGEYSIDWLLLKSKAKQSTWKLGGISAVTLHFEYIEISFQVYWKQNIYLSNICSHKTSYCKSVKTLDGFLGHSYKEIDSRNFPIFQKLCHIPLTIMFHLIVTFFASLFSLLEKLWKLYFFLIRAGSGLLSRRGSGNLLYLRMKTKWLVSFSFLESENSKLL